MTNLTCSIGLASRRGPRERNEDAAGVSPDHRLLVIADGIGGAPLGDIMSTAACNAALESWSCSRSIEAAFTAANSQVIGLKRLLWTHSPATENLVPLTTTPTSESAPPSTQAHASFPTAGSGTTLLLAECAGEALNLAWAGDSIALRLRDGALETLANPDNIEGSNQLGSAVGYVEGGPAHRASCDLRAGDRVLLCTDGVWATLPAPWVAQVIAKEASERGHDNATAIVAFFTANEEGVRRNGEGDAEDAPLTLPPVPCTPSYPAISYF